MAAVLAFLVGCTGRNSYAVVISEVHQFDPGSLDVLPGTTIVFKNMSTEPHTITNEPSAHGSRYMSLPVGASPFDSGTIYTGETFSHTFETPGVYVYVSRFPRNRYHSADGNTPVGVIRVRAAGGAP